MYAIDERDKVIASQDLPPPSAGAPLPLVFANENDLLLSYYLAPDNEQRAVLRFSGARTHYFGSPNDEALSGHPLYDRGLRHYGVFEVIDSSWIRSLERMNRVHRLHDPAVFETLRHFVITFHDKTFECVARRGSVLALSPAAADDGNSLLLSLADWAR